MRDTVHGDCEQTRTYTHTQTRAKVYTKTVPCVWTLLLCTRQLTEDNFITYAEAHRLCTQPTDSPSPSHLWGASTVWSRGARASMDGLLRTLALPLCAATLCTAAPAPRPRHDQLILPARPACRTHDCIMTLMSSPTSVFVALVPITLRAFGPAPPRAPQVVPVRGDTATPSSRLPRAAAAAAVKGAT